MYLLLVDDEDGIREGLAAFLRLQGCQVETAADRGSALAALADGDFDAVVTDWHLPDGDAAPLLEAARAPVVAVSGFVEEIPNHPRVYAVLSKPLSPSRLQEALREVLAPRPSPEDPIANRLQGAMVELPLRELLPADTGMVLDLLLAALGADHSAISNWEDDGTLLTVDIVLPAPAIVPDPEGVLERVGGDLQVLVPGDQAGSANAIRWRVYRDVRPADGCRRLTAAEDWPADRCAAGPAGWYLDLSDDRDASPARALRILRRLAALPAGVRPRAVLHGPEWLPLLAERFGLTGGLPKRSLPGPRVDAQRASLWSTAATLVPHRPAVQEGQGA